MIVPIVNDLEQDNTASFHFIHGTVPSPPPNGFEEFFGAPPHLRFLDSALLGVTEEEFQHAVLQLPQYLTPEQKHRSIRNCIRPKGTEAIEQFFDRIHRIADEDPFDGILGNSEGATMAATFLVDYLRKIASKERDPFLRCAVFMSGGAPYTADGKGVLLADEHGQVINIPTCHIIGYNDSFIDNAIALYHLCEEDSATIVDHGKGHMIPYDEKSSKIMIRAIRKLIASCSTSSSRDG